MAEYAKSPESSDAWYTVPGKDCDVVLSSRTRLSRNLANFPFPQKLAEGDSDRIQSLVFDAFNSLENGSSFQAISVSHLDSLGSRILQERGILEPGFNTDAGIIIRNDGKISCSVNIVDHLRIVSFVSGFQLQESMELSRSVDEGLQDKLQFAASYDFGYLTSSVLDAGSGMKLSLRFHLPCLSITGKIRRVAQEYQQQGFDFRACFGSGTQSAALGYYYQLSTTNAINGSETEQLSELIFAAEKLIGEERQSRPQCYSQITLIRNMVYRSLALVKASLLISLREAIEIISSMKLGLNLKLISGTDDSALNALLYRIQEGHLEYVLKNGDFKFETDLLENQKAKSERLRTLILQEAFEKVILV